MKRTVISVCVAGFFLMFASFAFAQDYAPLAPLPGTYTGAVGSETTNLGLYLSGAIKLLIALGAMFSILVAIIGGTQYVASGIAPSAKQDAKDRITNAFIGLILVLTSYLILNSINPNLVAFNFNLPPIGTSPTVPITPPSPPVQNYAITANSVANGTISPSGVRNVTQGGSQQYLITPNIGYHTATLVIDSIPVATSSIYTFSNIQTNHTIGATFAPNSIPPNSNVLSASVTAGGTISPMGVDAVPIGSSRTYMITPDPGFVITTLRIDGVSVATSTSYTFNNITSSHTINVTFASPSTPPAMMNISNDYSIISHCVGNTTYSLCTKTDLNNDGKTDNADVALFRQRGNVLNVNQNTTLELADGVPASAKSCFFKVPTVNVHNMLPRYRRIGLTTPAVYGTFCSGTGKTMPPNVACNGATWLKYSTLGATCAVDTGLLGMPFGHVFNANGTFPGEGGILGQYTNYMIWINGANTANGVNLLTLFHKTFLAQVPPPTNVDPYLESNLGKIAYTTIAQYDLNNDGFADFNAGGPDRVIFNGCIGQPVSGVCVNADFNSDGVIDNKDLAFSNDLFTGPGIPLGWKLDWFESRYFDQAGYNDKQIINYCLGRKAFEKCGSADVNMDNLVNSTDLNDFNTGAPILDFNGDGVVNLQ